LCFVYDLQLEGWRTKVAIHAILGSVVLRRHEDGHESDSARDEVSEILDVLRRYAPVLSSAIDQDSSHDTASGRSVAAQILLTETDWLCGRISQLLVIIVLRLFLGELHLVSLTSLMEFLMIQMVCSSGRPSQPNVDITYVWDIANSCLGNYVEVGIKRFFMDFCSSKQSNSDDEKECGVDEAYAERKMGALSMGVEEQLTLNTMSNDIVASVLYTMECVLSAAAADRKDVWTPIPATQPSSKLSPRISRWLDGLRAYILAAQTRTLELYYASLSVLDKHRSSSTMGIAWSDIGGAKLAGIGKDIVEKYELHKDDVGGRQVNRGDVQLISSFIRILERGGGNPIA
jgi:hypothetical protein